MEREEKLDFEIDEECLRDYIDDFRGFASRKKSREYRKRYKMGYLSHRKDPSELKKLKAELVKRTKSELVFLLYRLLKRQIDPAMRTMYLNHLREYSKKELIKKIINEYSIDGK